MTDPDTFEISYASPDLLNPVSADLTLGGGIGVPRPVAAPDLASFDNLSLKLSMKYELSDNAQAFATVFEGFKSGGFNGRLADGQLEPYDEETLTSYEIGLKSQWLDDRLRANAVVFHTDYEDLQVSSFTATPDGSTFLPVFTNAGEARIQGVELEQMALLTDRLSVTANLDYLDAEYDEFLAGGEAAVPPQPMVAQMRAVLRRYAANGGRVDESVVKGAGHSPFLEKPRQFLEALCDFLSE